EILTKYPQLGIASDQPYREFDLAIDFCEDVPRAPWEVVDDVVAIFQQHGAQAKISSIHVNGWFGDFNKLKMARLFLSEQYGVNLGDQSEKEGVLFIGDSPNDQPMFEFFPITVGVVNIIQFWDRLEYRPKYVTTNPSGVGFAEFARVFLTKRVESP
ncbi:MAG TPA: HAD family hydrolase, partial [Candidatus Lokiarchaeia archaeon]|nr:HAD family hydrolase [Candidatus Lokiarchaeia archaeon]